MGELGRFFLARADTMFSSHTTLSLQKKDRETSGKDKGRTLRVEGREQREGEEGGEEPCVFGEHFDA